MKLRQMIAEVAKAMRGKGKPELAEALSELADNGSGDDIYSFLGAVRKLAKYAEEVKA